MPAKKAVKKTVRGRGFDDPAVRAKAVATRKANAEAKATMQQQIALVDAQALAEGAEGATAHMMKVKEGFFRYFESKGYEIAEDYHRLMKQAKPRDVQRVKLHEQFMNKMVQDAVGAKDGGKGGVKVQFNFGKGMKERMGLAEDVETVEVDG